MCIAACRGGEQLGMEWQNAFPRTKEQHTNEDAAVPARDGDDSGTAFAKWLEQMPVS